ncbi:16S rRNA (cytidine(1402)-2'-O)-methyltransferase [Helcococcus sueciensis]|uniref:16S rRNA (cytidine(1402)-2'-O)-methyltransferase n=1 Tax=Helcococcus sueciensis TaxID=241555 RepID=UPI00040B5980|nr:16S rRNA (cytidine(1402)-2'-O)-methyltransferase [Helcococcus sueciensis]
MIYFVATPIGNLEDITLRSLRVLKESDIIYCEDTRNTKRLLDHYDIEGKLYSYHKFNEQKRVDEIINLSYDNDISIVSDAGMPGISDPGNILVKAMIENNIPYTVLPGATAFATALVLSGFDNSEFTFLGFLPSKSSDRKKILENMKKISNTLIFYESPHRIIKTLEDISLTMPDRKVAVIREISKIYEDVKIFKSSEYKDEEIVEKGEIVVLLDRFEEEIIISDDFIKDKLEELKKEGMLNKMAVKQVSKELEISKNRVYEISLKI